MAAVFDRSLTTTESAYDYIIAPGYSYNGVWAWGDIVSNGIQYHGN